MIYYNSKGLCRMENILSMYVGWNLAIPSLLAFCRLKKLYDLSIVFSSRFDLGHNIIVALPALVIE